MYEIPSIDWIGIVEYLKPLLFNLGEYKSFEKKESIALLHFECCKLLLQYDAKDRFISTYILVSDEIIDANHIVQLTPSFDYFLNGSFKEYLETLNKSQYKYQYTNNKYIIFDYIVNILNSKGLENYINNGLKIDEYSHWLKENGPTVNKELLKLYNDNCLREVLKT